MNGQVVFKKQTLYLSASRTLAASKLDALSWYSHGIKSSSFDMEYGKEFVIVQLILIVAYSCKYFCQCLCRNDQHWESI